MRRSTCRFWNELHVCHLNLNRQLAGLPVSGRNSKATIAVTLKMARLADERREFMTTLLEAMSLR